MVWNWTGQETGSACVGWGWFPGESALGWVGPMGEGAEWALLSHAWEGRASEEANKAEWIFDKIKTSETTEARSPAPLFGANHHGGQDGLLDGFLFPSLEAACDMNICVLFSPKLETYGGVLQKESKTNSAVYVNIRRKTQWKGTDVVYHRPWPHSVFNSWKGFGLMRGVIENISRTQAEPTLPHGRMWPRHLSILSPFPPA